MLSFYLLILVTGDVFQSSYGSCSFLHLVIYLMLSPPPYSDPLSVLYEALPDHLPPSSTQSNRMLWWERTIHSILLVVVRDLPEYLLWRCRASYLGVLQREAWGPSRDALTTFLFLSEGVASLFLVFRNWGS